MNTLKRKSTLTSVLIIASIWLSFNVNCCSLLYLLRSLTLNIVNKLWLKLSWTVFCGKLFGISTNFWCEQSTESKATEHLQFSGHFNSFGCDSFDLKWDFEERKRKRNENKNHVEILIKRPIENEGIKLSAACLLSVLLQWTWLLQSLGVLLIQLLWLAPSIFHLCSVLIQWAVRSLRILYCFHNHHRCNQSRLLHHPSNHRLDH